MPVGWLGHHVQEASRCLQARQAGNLDISDVRDPRHFGPTAIGYGAIGVCCNFAGPSCRKTGLVFLFFAQSGSDETAEQGRGERICGGCVCAIRFGSREGGSLVGGQG